MSTGERKQISAYAEVNSLVLQHLETVGVPTNLVSEVRLALSHLDANGHRKSSLHNLLVAHGLVRDVLEPPLRETCTNGDSDKRESDGKGKPKASLLIRRCQTILPCLVVIFLSLIFSPCMWYSEWYIDELFATVRNADARGETPLLKVLSHDFWGNPLWNQGWTHKSYRPLVILSYAFQYWFNDGIVKPQPLRAFNVLLHCTNSGLLYVLIRRYGTPKTWACLASCLFAVHPVHCENVIYLVGRADALATFCWLLALISWPLLRSRELHLASSSLRLALVTFLAVVGGLCKESGFCVLFQLAVGELMSRQPFRGSTPLLVAFGIVFWIRSWFTQGTSAGFSFVDTPVQYNSDPMVRTFTYLYFHSKYAQLLVLPWSLSWDYSYDALPLLRDTWKDARFLGALATYCGIVSLASYGFSKRSRRLLFGLSNVIVPFVPASNLFFIVGTTIGERLLYPCNVGGALVVAALGAQARPVNCSSQKAGRSHSCYRRIGLALLLLTLYLYRCGLRVYQWQSREHLFEPDLIAYPRSAKSQHQFATILHRQSRFEEAKHHFEQSLDIFSDNALSEYCIAQILIETGRPQEALVRFEHILQGHGLGFGGFNIYALYIDYGFCLMMLRRCEEAIPMLLQGLKLNEDVPHGLNALGYCYVQLRNYPEAQNTFERGLHYDAMNPWLVNNLGATMMFQGNVDKGGELLAQAGVAEPTVPAFAHNMRLLQVMVQTQSWPSEQFVLELFFNRGH